MANVTKRPELHKIMRDHIERRLKETGVVAFGEINQLHAMLTGRKSILSANSMRAPENPTEKYVHVLLKEQKHLVVPLGKPIPTRHIIEANLADLLFPRGPSKNSGTRDHPVIKTLLKLRGQENNKFVYIETSGFQRGPKILEAKKLLKRVQFAPDEHEKYTPLTIKFAIRNPATLKRAIEAAEYIFDQPWLQRRKA